MTDISPSENKAVELIQKVAAIERYMEECQSKLFACRQDMKYLSYGRGIHNCLYTMFSYYFCS